MFPQTQVKVFETGFATFGSVALRRLTVCVGGQLQQLLVHERSEGAPYLLAEKTGGGAQPPLILTAEWGEPLAEICELHADKQTGLLEAYSLWLRQSGVQSKKLRLSATDTYWWQGGLYCRKKASYQLRDLPRCKQIRGRSEAA